MLAETTVFGYISHASPVVKGVIAILLMASMVSWAFILQRGFFLKKRLLETQHFLNRFWYADSIEHFFQSIKAHSDRQGLAAIFYAGFSAYQRLQTQTTTPAAMADSVERAMQASLMEETDRLEQYVPWLATIGSVSPYVGLFGTVWGIMLAFHGLANVQQATIAMVAPGISEALIATAMGLFAAIPAVIAYNRLNHRIEKLLNQYDAFSQKFLSLLYSMPRA